MVKTRINLPVFTWIAAGRALQAIQHQEKLSYNNINDTDAAFELVSEFAPEDGAACAIIKHANPCGVARGADLRRLSGCF